MSSFNFITVRLGKDSLQDINRICLSEVGVLKNGFTINVKCTQIPDNYKEGDYAFIWLGSDNNKGMPTKWKQGFKAVGRVMSVKRGSSYNDTSETIITIVYVFRDAVNRMDILRCAPIAYYWCSSLPLIGIDDHANQTIRSMISNSFSDIRAFFVVLESVTNSFKKDIIQIEHGFEKYFDIVLPNPNNYPDANNLNELFFNKPSNDEDLPLQRIFYGAPGTGKSNTIKREVDDKGKACIRTTFHPDSDYSTFVGAYKPTSIVVPVTTIIGKEQVLVPNAQPEKKIVYEYVGQAFFQAYVEAWKNYAAAGDETPKEQYLVIEEINRGNCAQIFGDLFQLLDRNDSGFSDYPIKADTDLKKQLAEAFCGLEFAQKDKINALYKNKTDVVAGVLNGDILLLPNNLYIWATMNTSDQSLFPIDSAFKRRWDWEYMPIANANKNWKIELKGLHLRYDWWEFLVGINKEIEKATSSEDKKLGYFFCKAKDDKGIIDAKTFVSKVIFYLWNDVFKDFADETATLFKAADGESLSFNDFYRTEGNTIAANEVAVQQFLNNLKLIGVKVEDAADDEDDSEDDVVENDENGKTKPKDQSKYTINGDGPFKKSPLASEIVYRYLNSHPEASVEETKSIFNNITPLVDNYVRDETEYNQLAADEKRRVVRFEWGDGNVIYITKRWSIYKIPSVIDFVNNSDWGMTIAKVE